MAAALLVLGLVLVRQAQRLPIGWTQTGPGAGFFPFWLSIGVTLFAAVILVQTLRIRSAPVPANGEAESFIPSGAWKPLLVVILPMIAVVGMLRYLGLYIGGAVYLAGYMWLVGRHRPLSIVLVSVLIPLALFLIFERWFLLLLPKGVILEYFLYGR